MVKRLTAEDLEERAKRTLPKEARTPENVARAARSIRALYVTGLRHGRAQLRELLKTAEEDLFCAEARTLRAEAES